MLIFSQVRGPHSTGVGSVSKDEKDVIVCKNVGRPDVLIDYDKRYDKAVDYGKKFILGHNRYATTGKINRRNAHPFTFEHIMGCHNGTVPEDRLKKLKVDYNRYGTDSEAVLASIDEHGVEKTFKELSGAWCFVWYDIRDNSVNILRNYARDLYYTYSKDRKTLFWASEDGFLRAALKRQEIHRDEIYEVPVNQHVKWIIPAQYKEYEKPSLTDVESFSWGGRSGGNHGQGFFPETGGGMYSDWDGSEDDTLVVVYTPAKFGKEHLEEVAKNSDPLRIENKSGQNSRSGSSENESLTNKKSNSGETSMVSPTNNQMPDLPESLDRRPKDDSKNTIINSPELDFRHPSDLRHFDGQGYFKKGPDNKKGITRIYRGFRGEQLNKAAFEDATKEGCAWCAESAIWGQPVRFIDHKRHICLECNNDPTVSQYVGAA